MGEELTTFLIVVGVILTVVGLAILIVNLSNKYDEKRLEKVGSIIKDIDIDEMIIEKFDKFVDIKMMSGDEFEKIDMKEYESINDPMKKGSYRIHRRAIESERHYSVGNGYLIHNGKKMKLTIYGDEDMNITKIVDDEKSKYLDELLHIKNIRYILWDFRQNRISISYYSSWTEDTFKLER